MAAAGPMYQAGTLSGNPLAMTAGIETLKELHRPSAWQQLELRSAQLADGLRSAADEAGVAATFNRVGTMFTTFFTDQPVTNWASAKACDTQRFGQFFRAMLERGVYLAPSQFEAGFMSLAHGETEINATIAAAREAFQYL